MNICRSTLLIIIVLVAFINSTFAAENIFCVPNVDVYSESDTLDNAKREAVNKGIESSFKMLLARLLPQETLWKVSSLKKNNAYDSLSEMNATFERMTSSSYMAKIDFCFNPKKVKTILNRMGIYYTDSYSPQYLIIPILIDGKSVSIWENDEWFSAWESMPAQLGLTRFSYILGDLVDETLIDPAAYAKKDYKNLSKVLSRYNAQEAYIIVADSSKARYNITIQNVSKDGKKYEMSVPVQPEINNEAFFKEMSTQILLKIDSIYKCFDSL